jgi:hypothetical protein
MDREMSQSSTCRRSLRVTQGFPGGEKFGRVAVVVDDLTGCSSHAATRATVIYHIMFDHDVMDRAGMSTLWRALLDDPVAWFAAIKQADCAAGNVLQFPDLSSLSGESIKVLQEALVAAPTCAAPSFPCTLLACSFNAYGDVISADAAVVCHLPLEVPPRGQVP